MIRLRHSRANFLFPLQSVAHWSTRFSAPAGTRRHLLQTASCPGRRCRGRPRPSDPHVDYTAIILWNVLASCRRRIDEWRSDERMNVIENFIYSVANWIVEYASGDELSMLLGATINILLGQCFRYTTGGSWRSSHWETPKQMKYTNMLVNRGARPVVCSSGRPPGYTWFSAGEELFKHEPTWFSNTHIDRHITNTLLTPHRESVKLTCH